MKVLIDCVPLSVGGGVQVAIALLINLREQANVEWQAVVPTLLRSALPAEVSGDPRVVFVPKRYALDRIWLRSKLIAIERAFAPDVVFTVFGPAYFRARALHVVGFALPGLIYDQDGPPNAFPRSVKMGNWLRRILLRKADHLVVETQTVRLRLAQRLGINGARISVIGNSVNPVLSRLICNESRPDDRFGILIPSTYYPHKNLGITPPVAAALRKLNPNLDFEFRFTLDLASSAWRALAADADRLGVADRLVTLGTLQLDDLARAYRAASAVFLPTLSEASTAVYPESFFFRRPLVTSDMDFSRELCGTAALYVSPLEPEQIAARLVELARSSSLRTQLVEAGKRQLGTYPSPKEKFEMQMNMLARVAELSATGQVAVSPRVSRRRRYRSPISFK
jgi:glycosyltransferase involved in cell wall biosynthesis